MKTMFYSEVLDKSFEDEKECRRAELQYQLDKQAREKAEKAAEEKKKEETALISKEKKELSKAIEDAEAKLSEAYNNYDLKQKEVRKLYEEYKAAASELLNPARDAVNEAEQERYRAISDFNNKFGKYQVFYTGDRAYKEFQRASSMIDRIFNNFWF